MATISTPTDTPINAGEECCVCLTVPEITDCYVLPCTHTLCGKHAQEIGIKYAKCPLCNKPFVPSDVHPVIDASGSLDIFCFDTSTSMWYSDKTIPLFGWSKLHISQEMARLLIGVRRVEHLSASREYSVCVSRFDSDWLLLLNPTKVSSEAEERLILRSISTLQPLGKYTAFFDSYLRLIKYLEAAPRFRKLKIQVFFFTDGQNNLDTRGMNAVPEELKGLENKLHLMQFVINIGGDVPRTRQIADMIKAEFINASSYDWEEKANGIVLSIEPMQIPSTTTTTTILQSTKSSTSLSQQQQNSNNNNNNNNNQELQTLPPSTTTNSSNLISSAVAEIQVLQNLPSTPTHNPNNSTQQQTSPSKQQTQQPMSM